jgi:uncharacterized membrane protein required for colicin V production
MAPGPLHGLTWIDVAVAVFVAGFAIRGFFRGSVVQVFAVIGLVAGVVAAGWIARWVGHHWVGARPAAVFWVVRWLVAGLGGVAVASLAGWIGGRLHAALRPGPAAWMDRALGVPIGAATGLATMATLLLVALLMPYPRAIGRSVARARVASALMAGGARTCSLGAHVVPGTLWLGHRFEDAERLARLKSRSS